MTVIAGASLFNGVILLADTRATIQRSGRPDIHCDVAQKLFQLTTSTVIGFSGDVRTASALLTEAVRQLQRRQRKDGASLAQWLPRFLRTTYRALAKRQAVAPVSFMVGSVLLDRPNIVERSKVVNLFETIGFGRSRIQRSFIPDILMRVMMTPAEAGLVAINGTVRGLLYTMHAPAFLPAHHKPLEYCAIGSGQGAVREISETADWLLAGQPGNDLIEMLALSEAASEFCAAQGIDGVGGTYPCVKVDRRGVSCLGHSMGVPGKRVAIGFDPALGRWVQTNEATGKAIELKYPWEIDVGTIGQDQRFDDWHEAIRAFNPRRLQRKKSSS